MKRASLRTRLIVSFCILITLAWAISAGISYIKTRHRIRYIFDAQQIVFAERLEDSDLQRLLHTPPTSPLLTLKRTEFRKANDALSFAVFNSSGQKLLSDRPESSTFVYDPTLNFDGGPVFRDSNQSRILWHRTADGRFIIAVGQENAYRNRFTGNIIFDHQIMPWFLIMPALIAAIIYCINRELKPINQLSQALAQRTPDDGTPEQNDRLPLEIQPLLDALNALFARIASMLERERRFVSNAAHELRTPLAALKIQTDVAQISMDKPYIQKKALDNLTIGIERASRLIEQLLTLSKLDSFAELPHKQDIDWRQIIDALVDETADLARKKNITVTVAYLQFPKPFKGDSLLLSLMLRNLLDNALRYSCGGGLINIELSESDVIITDDGPGVSDSDKHKIGQRFYRPPGQKQTGSGLGLSITRQIAELHQFSFTFGNRDSGGFFSRISFNHS